MGQGKVIRPFANGSELMMFDETNCQRCSKSSSDYTDPDVGTCDIQNALLDAQCEDGTITLEIAKKAGFDLKKGKLIACKEFTQK